MSGARARDPDGRDAVLAAERTDLAWNRSGLALIGCGAAVLRGVGRPPLQSGAPAVGAAILTLGLVAWLMGRLRDRAAAVSGAPATARDLLPAALGVALIGVAAFVLAAFFPA